MGFAFELGDEVVMIGTVVAGIVVGRVEYVDAERVYLVKCDAANEAKLRHWLDESLLTKNAPLLPAPPEVA